MISLTCEIISLYDSLYKEHQSLYRELVGRKMKLLKLHILIGLLLMFLFVASCSQQTNKYESYPFEGKSFYFPEPNYSVLPGTYIATDYYDTIFFGGYGASYFVSFKEDGTLIATPREDVAGPINSPCEIGSWSLNGNAMSLDIFGSSYRGSVLTLDGVGFGISKTTTDRIAFIKVSDSFIETDAFVNHTLVNGLYMTTNKYGEKSGIRLLPDGTCWQYSTNKSSVEGAFKISTKGTIIRINTEEYNFVVFGNNLVLGSSVYLMKIK